ncbi:uncharacterized protein LOC119099028 [Pollicipes pollicipes]|uniref:uncharacterized protein LOC119099028 n=1 Tax=Pollicipes pollicipes TaxID=41117 RepID=UPI0018856D8F|nr:uncharacterized protein LOC119099028 [Pollicipes pollicipes]
MLGVIIFDRLNDVVFSHGDELFEQHIRGMSARNSLFYPAWSETVPETRSERADVLVQLFSPFLASQRIMGLEFHDPYSCIECENGLLMVFSEYLTYQFLCLGQHSSLSPRKYISVAVSLAKLLCGPVLTRLKSSDASLSRQLADMLTSYCELQRSSQAYHVEAVERLIIGDDVQNKMVSVLQRVVTGLPSGPRAHAFLAVDSTLVSLYSGRQVAELSPASFLHLLLLVNALKPSDAPTDDAEGGPSDDAEAGPRQPTAAIREVLCFLTASPLARSRPTWCT